MYSGSASYGVGQCMRACGGRRRIGRQMCRVVNLSPKLSVRLRAYIFNPRNLLWF